MAPGADGEPSGPFRIELLAGAMRQLEKLPRDGRAGVARTIDALAAEPHPSGAKLLSGTGDVRIWRVASGTYRILYQVKDDVLVVLIVRVADRREVYNSTAVKRLLKQLRTVR